MHKISLKQPEVSQQLENKKQLSANIVGCFLMHLSQFSGQRSDAQMRSVQYRKSAEASWTARGQFYSSVVEENRSFVSTTLFTIPLRLEKAHFGKRHVLSKIKMKCRQHLFSGKKRFRRH